MSYLPTARASAQAEAGAAGEPAAARRALVSFALPVYNEQEGLLEFYEALTAAVRVRQDLDFEFVFVDDGSSDTTNDILVALAQRDDRVVVVELSRNYGHQMAITAGVEKAAGDAVVVMDTDLQDPPPVALELVERWCQGAEIVYAQRRARRDTLFKRATASVFYRMLERLAEVSIPRDTGDFRLMDRVVVDAFLRHGERNRFVRGLVASLGFKADAVLFDRSERFAGDTKYPVRKMLRLAGDGIFGFSTVPLRIITRVGVASLLFSVLGVVYALVLRVFYPEISVPGWTLLMITVLFFGGLQMLALGIIGSYVGRIYVEVLGRPLYVVRRTIGRGGS